MMQSAKDYPTCNLFIYIRNKKNGRQLCFKTPFCHHPASVTNLKKLLIYTVLQTPIHENNFNVIKMNIRMTLSFNYQPCSLFFLEVIRVIIKSRVIRALEDFSALITQVLAFLILKGPCSYEIFTVTEDLFRESLLI